MTRILVATAVLAWLAGCGRTADHPRRADPVFVLAAVSTSEALDEAGRQYSDATGQEIRFSFAASNVLARQVREGLVADLIVSADARQVDGLERAGLIDARSRVPLFGNRLVLLVREGAPVVVARATDLVAPEIERIAIGDPAGVPAGVYAQQYLERLGLWAQLAPRIVPVSSVRAALAAVDHGHADAAFVYETDVPVARRARVAFVVSGPEAPEIVYPAALLTRSRAPIAARAFLSWLQGEAAAALFERHGFEALPQP